MDALNRKTLGREFALKFLYHLELHHFENKKKDLINGDEQLLDEMLVEFTDTYVEKDEEHPDNIADRKVTDFAKQLIMGILKNYQEIESLIKNNLQSWKIERLDRIDLCILMLGTYELSFEKETPTKVVINESVNLAKKFGGNNSFGFINGILDNISKKIRAEQT